MKMLSWMLYLGVLAYVVIHGPGGWSGLILALIVSFLLAPPLSR